MYMKSGVTYRTYDGDKAVPDDNHIYMLPAGDFYYPEIGCAGWTYNQANARTPSWNLFERNV
jgi:hypothetical protein